MLLKHSDTSSIRLSPKDKYSFPAKTAVEPVMVKREREVKMEPTEASIHEPVREDETVFKREYPEGDAFITARMKKKNLSSR